MFTFMQLCRLCAGYKDVVSSLTNLEPENITILDKLNTIAPGILETTSNLPIGVCTTCVSQLHEAYTFLTSCIKSQDILKGYLQSDTDATDSANKTEESVSNIDEDEYNLEKVKENFELDHFLVDFKTEPVEQSSDVVYPECSKSINIEKRYVCKLCNKAFMQKGNLKVHIRTHVNAKSYTCDVCEKTFSRNENLKVHLRTHTREKPYQCKICAKTFTQKVHLDTHGRIHTQEKPYKCELCNRTFSTSGNYSNHNKKFHSRTNK